MLQSCNISKTSSGSFSQFLIFKEPYPVISQEMQVKPYCSVKNESPVYLPHWILFASLTDSSIPYLLFSTTRLRGENNGERLFTEEPPGATRYSRGENSARLYVSDNIFWLQPGGKHNEDCTVEKWFIFFTSGDVRLTSKSADRKIGISGSTIAHSGGKKRIFFYCSFEKICFALRVGSHMRDGRYFLVLFVCFSLWIYFVAAICIFI